MEMNYDTFCQNYRRLKVNQKPIEYLLDDTLPIINEFLFTKNHQEFYPEGIFTDERLNLYFFTETHINKVSVLESGLEVTTWNLIEVASAKLVIPDRYKIQLEIFFKDGQKINLDSEHDTNSTWSYRFKDKIISIYNIISKK